MARRTRKGLCGVLYMSILTVAVIGLVLFGGHYRNPYNRPLRSDGLECVISQERPARPDHSNTSITPPATSTVTVKTKPAVTNNKKNNNNNNNNNNTAVTKRPWTKQTAKTAAATKRPSKTALPKRSKNWDRDIRTYLANHNKTCMEDWKNRTRQTGEKPLCHCLPQTLRGELGVVLDPRPRNLTEAENPEVKGGHWEPSHCTARYSVAVVIPYRDRLEHLGVLLRYLHPVLQGQQLNYTIIVVEQHLPKLFNKAALMNVGYVYAMQVHKPECVVFHDVDHIPEDGRHFYRCTSPVVHLGAYHSRYHYSTHNKGLFGAVTALRPTAFVDINGFSNRFFGWGGEDDDMFRRIHDKKYTIERHPRPVAGYRVIGHDRDLGNVGPGSYNANMHILFNNRNQKYDGLNTLRFNVNMTVLKPLYQWLYVELLNDRTRLNYALNER